MVVINARYRVPVHLGPVKSAVTKGNVLEMSGLAISCQRSMAAEMEDKGQLIPHFITCDATSNLKHAQVRLQ